MTVTTSRPETPARSVTGHRAAVVHDFHSPHSIEEVPARRSTPARFASRSKRRVYVTRSRAEIIEQRRTQVARA
jgi:hypothetical protein